MCNLIPENIEEIIDSLLSCFNSHTFAYFSSPIPPTQLISLTLKMNDSQFIRNSNNSQLALCERGWNKNVIVVARA